MNLNKLILILFLCSIPAITCLASENYTTFTEVDEQGDLTITAGVITVNSLRNDANSWVVKSYGANFFKDFTHTLKISGSAFNNGRIGVWAVSNSTNDWDALDAADDGIGVRYREQFSPSEIIEIVDFASGNIDATADINEGTFWLTIQRVGTTCACEIYSDKTKQTLVDTLTITCAATQYEYLYALLGRGSTTDASVGSGVIEATDIDEDLTSINGVTITGVIIK